LSSIYISIIQLSRGGGTPDGKAWTNRAPASSGTQGADERQKKIKSEIGNADLKRELPQAQRELTEAQQQQTATAHVLNIISHSTFDPQQFSGARRIGG